MQESIALYMHDHLYQDGEYNEDWGEAFRIFAHFDWTHENKHLAALFGRLENGKINLSHEKSLRRASHDRRFVAQDVPGWRRKRCEPLMQKQAIHINIKEGGNRIESLAYRLDGTDIAPGSSCNFWRCDRTGAGKKSNRAAGFRTNILVCLGSALIMLLSIYGFSAFSKEPSVRLIPLSLAAQVVSGIGFLGAGVILFNGFSITGLTTAATLRVVAAMANRCRSRLYYPALFTTILVLFSLLILNKIERNWIKARRAYRLELISEPEAIF